MMSRFVRYIEPLLPKQQLDIFGEDSLLMTSLPYYSLIAAMLLGYRLIWNHPWFLVLLIYAILPLLD